jgi:hypothetical protein
MSRIPLSYNNIKVKDFITCKRIEKENVSLADKRAALISHFTGKSIGSLSLAEVQYYRIRVDFLLNSKIKTKIKPILWLKWKRYKAITNIADITKDQVKISVNQATTAKELAKNEMSDVNIDKLIGLVYFRYKFFSKPKFNIDDYEEICNEMLEAKLGDVYPTVFFYSRVLETLNQILPHYLIQATETITEILKEIEDQIHGQTLERDMVGTM